MNKKEFEKLVGYKVTDGYYNDAARAFGLADGMTREAFASEWSAGADSSELVRRLAHNADALTRTIRDMDAHHRARLDEVLDLQNRIKHLEESLERASLNADDWKKEADRWKEEAIKASDLADAAEKNAAKWVKEAAARAKSIAGTSEGELARWRSAAEGMKRRMQTMIETEIIKAGWRAVNYQPCALLLQLLREELPEFDPVAYLKELSLKYNQ